MSAWTVGAVLIGYALVMFACGFLDGAGPIRPIRWMHRNQIAQHLADRVEFWGLDPKQALEIYRRSIGGLWLYRVDRIHEALHAAHERYVWREAAGYGLDVVSEIPARLVPSDPQRTTRAA